MKKCILLIVLFSCTFLFAQEKKIEFNKILNYEFKGNERETREILSGFKMYASPNNEFLSMTHFSGIGLNLFSDNLGSTMVNIGLGNKLAYSPYGGYMFGISPYRDEKPQDITVEKTKTSEVVNGITCNHYLLKTKNEYNGEDDNLKVCIDDKNSINNISVLSGYLDSFARVKISGAELKGLVLKMSSEKEYAKEYISLTSIKDAKETVFFDHRREMMKQQRAMDSIALAYKSMYEVSDSAYVDAAHSAAEAAADAVASEAVVDSIAWDDYYEGDYYIPEYQSSYKKPFGEPDYATDNIPNEKLWSGLPKHCKNFKNEIPTLTDKKFQNHLLNYVGQMCDMYLTQTEYHNVGIKITLDEIRREVLYINENKEKLNKEDKKKVDKYLEKLD